MTKEEADFIGGMNMCDEISNEAYKKIMCHCEEQEPCDDAISRQAVLDCLTATGLEKFDFILDARDKIKNLPPVNPQPKTGHWKRISMDKYVQHAMAFYKCSECGEDIIGEHNYCPNCGAKMQEVEE